MDNGAVHVHEGACSAVFAILRKTADGRQRFGKRIYCAGLLDDKVFRPRRENLYGNELPEYRVERCGGGPANTHVRANQRRRVRLGSQLGKNMKAISCRGE